MPESSNTYDVVVATRDRPDALELSLPLILGQHPPPQQLIVVDSSVESAPVAQVVASLHNPRGTDVIVINSEAGLTVQRNAGLRLVTAPIVFFPDDDALWHPGYAEHIMRIFDLDVHRSVGAVGGREVSDLPGLSAPTAYSLSLSGRLRRGLTPYRARFERKWFPEPVVLAARELMDRHSFPDWVDFDNVVPVEYITGFRMSFRTAFIATEGFDEDLHRYGLYEDADVSLRAWRGHLVLVDHRATVVHHKSPGGRETGWQDGYFHLLNYAYVVCKHTLPGSKPRLQLIPWSWYRFFIYAVRTRSRASVQRSHGALAGVHAIRTLVRSEDEATLRANYRALSSRSRE